ncbi:uncharacterized protein LOC125494156 [Beta vulgaris subsp. vulgaris]|uniref:uncharacterized protein LOC125494156 n=1 Tax=Beta vulgaris subsp. vulgaris TaxID=3555 RepID=UPI002036D5FB|nr:uncharacterized protein LOC125494156 [Beta vulgaris subsp. vulgaris]
MSNLTKREFAALDITGNNYLSWVLDAEIHLAAKDLGDTIGEGNKATSQNKAKAMIFLRHHLHEGLKIEYLTMKDPQVLWRNLKERYDHQKTVILPKARYDWLHLRLQDFKSTQYREKEFKKYSELISCLLVAEQNNELLMKNHESRPTGSAPLPEANATSHNGKEKYHVNNSGRRRGRERGYGYGYGRGCGRGYRYGQGRGGGGSFKNSYSHQKRGNKDYNKQEKDKNENVTNVCYRYGGKGHWSCTCRTPKHLVDLYQKSLKQKGKKVETNLVYKDGEGDFDCGNTPQLEVADFFTTHEGNN